MTQPGDSISATINDIAATISVSLQQRFGQFERRNATYCWTINRVGMHKLYGYSKPVGAAEKTDKQALLFDVIGRIHRSSKGYIRAGNSVEFYRCFTDDNRDNVKFLTMYETRFDLEPVALSETWLVLWLKNFYDSPVARYGTELFPKTAPVPLGGLQIDPTKPAYHNKAMYDETRTFKSTDKLLDYVTALLEKGEPKGQVEDYFRKMSIKLKLST
ncbi:hypothetical protein [Fibrella aquatilis]|uniref:Uncharacterized protein n=1 Tax=Fibrella aquatilis TaxID=2817059 RepID=A0A939JYY0_9BACT|nr:hypothetical protein [Fibrella aquatilis]MBO0930341.1 hypothetical protein [Fibrella aquatilis]